MVCLSTIRCGITPLQREQFASQVLGHSSTTITYNRYGKGVDVKRLVELVEFL